MRTISILFVLFLFSFVTSAQQGSSFILGKVDKLASSILGEDRILNIYLPEGYQKNDTLTYPVIYLLDGSADEDFIHVVGLVQFYSFAWVNQVPKAIVVGIATVDRRRDFTFPSQSKEDKDAAPTSGQSEKFISFIEKELQPYIDGHYRSNANKTLIGQSLGGLLASEILLKKPDLFNNYLIVSPSLWWDNASLLHYESSIFQDGYAPATSIYIAVGKEGLTPGKIPRVMEVDANLLADQLKASPNKNVKVYFDYLPDKNHATIMHQAVANGLEFLFRK